ncbi:MAG: metallophosphoesterase [Bacteroidales bacterium]|nr:metallophosphoesterase [Bacteroidales bacterium]
MYTEVVSVGVILLVCWVALVVVDLAVAGLLAWIVGWSFRRCFAWGLLSLAVPAVLMGYGILIERNCYRVNTVELAFDNLPKAFDGYTIVQLSDIHSRSFRYRTGSLQRAVERVNDMDADLIAFTGDIVTISPDELDYTEGILRRLKARDGVVSILGNHDYCPYISQSDSALTPEEGKEEVMARERAMGWRLLVNEHTILHRGGDSIAIVGVENTSTSPHFPKRGDLWKAMHGTEGMFHILLSHDPTHWDMGVIGKDVPLTLSGHTHAMQFSLLGWSPIGHFYKQSKGLYRKGKQLLYINIGLGETIFPARIGAMPEITKIVLKNS